ncbi:nitrate/nitrite transporter [Spectribacter hydrogenoxidans]|uniref:Nitrate/nitrite transporter n=1 Tax=Spectribacter hydrogenoxidans TaxID=3075608 RepID=A0ABU3BYD6_9GAMM|nr:nitrate/nitrite transporter [Salinisphaera sp. W335]MDT0634322.1 nitrate/nitrite transporter [Salinisphaera sp. W335]
MSQAGLPTPEGRTSARMLGVTTFAWSACFAAWTIFSILGVRIQSELGLSEAEYGLLISAPILTGAIARLPLGILAERFGGRWVTLAAMLVSAAATWLLASAVTYGQFILAALALGLSGAVFITGISFVARWYPRERHGTAFGLFGIGQVGAAATNFGAPILVSALGWEDTARVYAITLLAVAVLFWLFTQEDPVTVERRRTGAGGTSFAKQIQPLRYLRVWRFALYYFFVFGAFVALASWLPRYYTGVYGLELGTAGMLTAIFSFSAAVFRALGGWLSDRWGARRVMYITFIISLACLFLLSYPPTTYIVEGKSGLIEFRLAAPLSGFVAVTFLLGFVMSLGMAAVYKHIPVYYPENVGSVGGMVGMIGGLGGFFLPIAFGALTDLTNIWQTAFMALFAVVAVNLTWMHFAIQGMERRILPDLDQLQYLPEGIPLGQEPDTAPPAAGQQGAKR